jgi:prolyl oligopeptidase
VGYMKDAHHVLKIFKADGTFLRDIDLPTIGSVRGLSGRRTDTEMFFGFMSFTYPYTAFRYDFTTNEVSVFRTSDVKFDPSAFETKEVFSTSKDGTKVPMFITHKKGMALDGNRPVILYAYGGFNISMTPYFSLTTIPWMEQGGVYAVACIRGGDEYGEEWHEAAMLDKRQNAFDDFIGCAEWLVKNKYTNPKRLAIMGGSNGGLLVSAVMLQRPDLFGAVLDLVPVTDMLRYQKFTVGRYWVPEFGNAEESAEQFKYLYAYSPLHNVKPGFPCPPVLVTTADTDDRVAPLHAKKFVATLQANSSGDNPILLRVETKAGHGGGKPTSKRIEEATDMYTFLFKTFGMTM